jgi:hypothetical protein
MSNAPTHQRTADRIGGSIVSLCSGSWPQAHDANHLHHHCPRQVNGASGHGDHWESVVLHQSSGPRSIASWESPGVMVRGPGLTPPRTQSSPLRLRDTSQTQRTINLCLN